MDKQSFKFAKLVYCVRIKNKVVDRKKGQEENSEPFAYTNIVFIIPM